MKSPIEDRVVGRQLRETANRYPDRVFLQYADQSLTYGQFNLLTNRVANGIAGLGLGRGGKLALMTPNSVEFLSTWFGSAKAGAIYVPINTDYKGDILKYQLNKADVTHMLVDAGFLDRVEAIIGDLPKLTHLVIRGAAEVPKRVAAACRCIAFDELSRSSADEPNVEVLYTDPHAISFTSGTTGPSKGVLATHCHVTTFAMDWLRCTDFKPGQAVYSCLPQFHAIATWLGVLPTVLAAGRYAFVERFSATTYWDDVRRYKADVAHGIFSMVPILLKQPPRPDDATQPARTFYIGQQNREFEARFNCRIVEVFGSTETGIVTMTPYADERRLGSCGQPNTDTFDVIIADDQDQPVRPGEIGEILVRPRQPFSMLREYYNMPKESLEAFRNLWFHTGDNARIDKDGFIYFVDRKKDAIRRRGENISSFEVESVVIKHPAVLECAAIATPSELGEDEVKVVVVRQPGAQLTAQDLWAFCETHMPRFWVPRYVEFRDSLPKTPNQKVQKYQLRAGTDQGQVFDRGPDAGAKRSQGAK